MNDKESAKKQIAQLVEDYNALSPSEKRSYNEDRTKMVFIRPLFEALGWKFREDVLPEDKASRGRVDYAFQIDGIPKFFLEAKKLSVDLDDKRWAEQAITYAWHRSVTWAVLTDFESIKVFNAEVKSTDPFQSGLFFLNYNQYLDRFDDLWLLSRESFEQNLINQVAESRLKKLKKKPVDQQLLSDLMVFRDILTKSIVKNNPREPLPPELLDESVQRIIDRLIFIRACEDRELEPPTLRPLVREASHKKLSTRLNEQFRRINELYNSKLFQFHQCDQLKINDDALRRVILGLYRASDGASPYDFGIMPADVLGNIYEQYLGHILKRSEKRAKITSGEAHRKKQGIYYTPTYIVDYIVKSTLGELAKHKRFDMDNVKILDPACGSGSFLIKAYDFLHSYHTGSKKEHQQTLDLTGAGVTFTKKSQILKTNIFGVDLDPKATEIAQLNLLLKIAEKQRRLPLLQRNIRHGNSLIDDSNFAGDDAFKWEEEFKEIMDGGKFDVIIGNPPYVRQEEFLSIKQHLEANYETYHSMADLFVYFFERELKLLKEGGYFGMIVSNKWLKAGYGLKLRKFLSKYRIEEFIDFGDLKVFKDATTYPCIIIIQKKSKPNPKIKVCLVKTLDFGSLERYIKQNQFTVNQRSLDENGWNFQRPEISKLLKTISKNSVPLKTYVNSNVKRGILTGFNEAFVIDESKKNELIQADSKSAEIIKPYLTGKEVQPYGIDFKRKYIILTQIGVDIKRYPAIFQWLSSFQRELQKRWDKGNYWYELRSCDYYELFDKPKIIYGKITTRPRFTLDYEGYLVNDSNFFFPIVDKQLLGILNSKLGWFLITNTCTQIRGGYQLIWKYFGNVPIAKKKSPQIEILVDKMLSLNHRLRKLGDKKTDERERIEEEINKIDEKIDNLVYKLYGISDEKDQRIIEESFQ